jgi:putative amide transporter protein
MTLVILIAISLMWLPVALLFLGFGEAKGTGAITAFVGICVVVSAFINAIQGDAFTGGLLIAHGLLYCTVAYALLAGLESMASVGNVSLTVAIVSFVYMILYATVIKNGYFTFAAAGYTVLTLEVWLNAYGKFSAKALAWSLIIWVPCGLLYPAFTLLAGKPLPF